MTDTLSPPSVAAPARVVDVLVEPRATYADVATRPQWLGGLVDRHARDRAGRSL